jgi:hypothetical protein
MIDYKIDENGRFTRQVPGGEIEHVCDYKDGVLTYVSPEMRKFHVKVGAMLNQRRWRVNRIVVLGEPVTQTLSDAAPASETVTLGETKTVERGPIIVRGGLNPEQRKAVNKLRKDQGYPEEVEKDGPPCPKLGHLGDKEPAVVEWYLRYEPDEFVRRYKVIGLGSINDRRVKEEKDGKLRIEKFINEGVLADRKTHLTLLDPEAQLFKK